MISAESSALALTLGWPVDGRDFSWRRAFEFARAERCAALAWIRSGPAIRRRAPEDVAAMWRAEALATANTAHFWEWLLSQVVETLERAGVSAIVLKGLPLSQRLYGDICARPCSDLDLYIPADQRSAAHAALRSSGWRWRLGESPGEANYVLEADGRPAILEVHSRLLDDDLVAHLPLAAPGSRAVRLGARSILAHDDVQLPAFLATHLAKHSMAPMLWFVDFRELWSSLSARQRERAEAAAAATRTHRYLAWAVRSAQALEAAAGGDAAGAGVLGMSESGRRDTHNAVRVIALSASPLDVVRAGGGWLFPTAMKRDRQLRSFYALRLAKLARRVSRRRTNREDSELRRPGLEQAPRALPIGGEAFDALLAAVTQQEASFWIRASGRSMHPSIKAGALVRLNPISGHSIRVGDVVLARAEGESHVLHRVKYVGCDRIELQGDANLRADKPVSSRAVLAVADAVMVGHEVRPIPRARIARALRAVRSGLAQVRTYAVNAWTSRGSG